MTSITDIINSRNTDHSHAPISKNPKEEFIASLIAAQKAIKPIIKEGNNPHFKSKYADLSDILAEVKPALNDNNLFLFYTTNEDNVIAKIIHKNGEEISCAVPIKIKNEADKNDPQKYGSAMTYAKRYSLTGLLAISLEDDDGNSAADKNGNESSYRPKPLVPQETFDLLIQMIADSDTNDKLCKTSEEIKKMKEKYYFNAIQSNKLGEAYLERKKLKGND